ncbi:MAG: transcriptional regulator, LysR family [Oscillospiraceae bacterium]|nr:transcriptional regulator, LysR family [Oscillospiraceae bacterium]
MTLRHYTIFVTVCDTMNMTEAAERLYLSQPAVSQAVAELETHYGVRLFERLARRLYLTQPGQTLLGYARHILRLNGDAEAELKTLQQHGCVRVGASVTVGAYLLPELVSAFRQAYPDTLLQVAEDNTAGIERLILRDELDLGLVEGDITSRDLMTQCFMEDELFVICSPLHRFADMEVIDPRELEREPMILRETGSGTRKTFEDELRRQQLSPHVSWTCSNTDTIKAAVARGLGISAVSRLAVEREVASGELCLRPVRDIRFLRQFKTVYHKNKYLTDAMARLMALILTE